MSINVIPKPNHIILKDGVFNLSKSTKVSFDEKIRPILKFLEQYIKEATGLVLSSTEETGMNNEIKLKLDDNLVNLGEEGYKLNIQENQIVLEANTIQGLFYGVQTLRQIMNDNKYNLPCVEIEDVPRYEYRGYMLDVSRHFFDK